MYSPKARFISSPNCAYEDYDYSLNTKLHGPAVARLTLEPVVLEVGAAGIHRASAGIVKINGQPVPVISTEDGVIYYLPDATAEVTLSAGQPEAMEDVDASPVTAEALQLVEAENGTALGFEVLLWTELARVHENRGDDHITSLTGNPHQREMPFM